MIRSRTAGSVSRRNFLKGASAGVAGLALGGFSSVKPDRFISRGFPHIKNNALSRKVIAIGIDGMDPQILRRFVADGEMPTFQKIMASGHFGELGTTMPPHTPVAWSSFISGTNPGGHGIFDFIHREPKSFTPHLSTSRIAGGARKMDVGNWSIPLEGGKAELMRKGPEFWHHLEERDIPAVLFQLPSNFPVNTSKSKAVSGMGTPDLLGSYGTFTFFSETEVPGSKDFTGGKVVRVSHVNHVFKSKITGPKNAFRADAPLTEVDVTIYRDPNEQIAKIDMGGEELILRRGEWSDWIPLRFRFVPWLVSISGMARVYLKEVHPYLKLYVSPINMDPLDPSLPICSPEGYSKEVAEAIGRFHTQGFPTDTKSLSHGVLSEEEYLEHAKLILNESLKAFDFEFARFNEGFFFFYFSSIDQNSHMLWRTMDPAHPLYDPQFSKEVKDGMGYFYRAMDEVLRKTLSKVDSSTTLMVLSDHGFVPFTREFHLSTWMHQNGFIKSSSPGDMAEGEFFQHVDWQRTSAYALGLNGIYLNLEGREGHGSLPARAGKRVKQEIAAKLLEVIDPATGQRVVSHVYDAEEIYSPTHRELSPDLVVGYAKGYRVSDEAVLGEFPATILSNRTNKWSADHCVDAPLVPGILLTNKPWAFTSPVIWDMAPTILKAFGIDAPKEMEGKPVLEV